MLSAINWVPSERPPPPLNVTLLLTLELCLSRTLCDFFCVFHTLKSAAAESGAVRRHQQSGLWYDIMIRWVVMATEHSLMVPAVPPTFCHYFHLMTSWIYMFFLSCFCISQAAQSFLPYIGVWSIAWKLSLYIYTYILEKSAFDQNADANEKKCCT